MTVVGGLRERLILDSFYNTVIDALDALGWLTSAAGRADVTVLAKEVESDEQIEPNLVAIFADDTEGREFELGSNFMEERRSVWVDVLAENDAVGEHLSGDIRDILRGKIPSIGRTGPHFGVVDETIATPVEIFVCQIEDVEKERGRNPANASQKYWYAVSCTVVDVYGDENDS